MTISMILHHVNIRQKTSTQMKHYPIAVADTIAQFFQTFGKWGGNVEVNHLTNQRVEITIDGVTVEVKTSLKKSSDSKST